MPIRITIDGTTVHVVASASGGDTLRRRMPAKPTWYLSRILLATTLLLAATARIGGLIEAGAAGRPFSRIEFLSMIGAAAVFVASLIRTRGRAIMWLSLQRQIDALVRLARGRVRDVRSAADESLSLALTAWILGPVLVAMSAVFGSSHAVIYGGTLGLEISLLGIPMLVVARRLNRLAGATGATAACSIMLALDAMALAPVVVIIGWIALGSLF